MNIRHAQNVDKVLITRKKNLLAFLGPIFDIFPWAEQMYVVHSLMFAIFLCRQVSSPMLLFNHAVENNLEERFDESKDYPEVVTHIQNWITQHNRTKKRVVIPD